MYMYDDTVAVDQVTDNQGIKASSISERVRVSCG